VTETRTPRPSACTVVVPCGAEKLEGTHAARDLYTSSHFRATLTAAERMAEAEGGRVFILSALYGLLELDERVGSYNVKLGEGHPAEVTVEELTAQLAEFGIGDDVYAMLPAAYFARLDAACREAGVLAFDLFEADAGIGYQRGTAKSIRTSYAA
jgi:hypothetical protein